MKAVVICVLLLVLVAGCGGTSGASKSPAPASPLKTACNALNDPQTKGMSLFDFGERQRKAVAGTTLQHYFDQLNKLGDAEDFSDEGVRAYNLAARAIRTNIRSECATVGIQVVPQPGEDGFVLNE